jgi:cation diffusion facilitator CzcD-associated flavoprotein CzcO
MAGQLQTPRIAIIGGGFSGIGMAVKLVRAGIRSFTVYERADGAGGTWWINRYPGAQVDTPSHLYSFSFKSVNWRQTHADQDDLLRYLDDVVEEYGLLGHFRLGTAVLSATWDARTGQYEVSAGGTSETYDVVVSAVGLLSEPRYPEWPGLDRFEGPVFHTMRWRREHDLAGRTVAVVGVGSSGTQIVPALAPLVRHLYVFQREPGWILPKGERSFTPDERVRYSRAWRRRLHRARLFAAYERDYFGGGSYRPGTRRNDALRRTAEQYIAEVFADRPDLARAVTPSYPFFGKRPVKSSTFYPALLRDNVELVSCPVREVTRSGIVDASGTERAVDAVVLATGFRAAEFLSSLTVTGEGGNTLADTWRDGAFAFAGLMVPGFPNFFMLYGPNTNGGHILFNLERQADFVVRAVRRLVRPGRAAAVVRPGPTRWFNRWLQHRMVKTAWPGANNYFKAESGKVVTQWVDGLSVYWLATRIAGPLATRKARLPEPGK